MRRIGVIVISCMLMLSMSCMIFAQTQPSNAMLFKQLIAKLSNQIKQELPGNAYSMNIVGGNDEKEFLGNEFMKNNPTIDWSSKNRSIITITPTEMHTAYSWTQDDEALKRTCSFSGEMRIEEEGKSRIVSLPLTYISDTITADDISYVQVPGYTFCIGKTPEQQWNALDGLVKPMLYVLTLGFSTWLLFSVRTQ